MPMQIVVYIGHEHKRTGGKVGVNGTENGGELMRVFLGVIRDLYV